MYRFVQVENALKGVPGVQEAAVSLVTHKAEVGSPPTNLPSSCSLRVRPPRKRATSSLMFCFLRTGSAHPQACKTPWAVPNRSHSIRM